MITFVKSAVKHGEYPNSDFNEAVIVGRSNVGKSSFINALFNCNISKVGKTPGKTRLLNFFNVDDKFMFVDVPGYGFAKLSDEKIIEFGNMMENYFEYRKQLKMLILIVDARHRPTNDDVDMINFAKLLKLKIIVIANKIDKVKNSEYKQRIAKIIDRLNISKNSLYTFSSITKVNGDKIYSDICSFLK